jgi:UDP-N-acetylmuramoyl-L-alanyl-D-glutamate--2,6-diaminopimelate ligase
VKLQSLFPEVSLSTGADLDIAGLTADSRKVRPGYLFAALSGSAAHGRDFVDFARTAGAAAILSAGDLDADPDLPHVIAADARLAFALAARRFYPRQPALMAAVTGTNGKSSTVDFLRQIWTSCGLRAASLGTLGAIGPGGVADLGHTTPDPVSIHQTLQALADDGVAHAAMEASSHGLDQRRLDGVALNIGAFTNLTQDHLDYHNTMDGYRAAKLRLWELVPVGGSAVVNVDAVEAPAFEAAARARGLELIGCGWRAGADGLKITEIWPRADGQRLDLSWRGAHALVDLPLIGEFQALNAVTAAAMALAGGTDPQAVFAALAHLMPVKGRIEHVGATREGAHVFVDYAHTADGLDVLLRAARPHAPGRIVLVFGCGGDRDAGKRPKMGEVAARHADIVFVTDDNPRSEDPAAIRAQVLAGCPGAEEIGDRRTAIEHAVALLQAGDALLIAGKGHETGQIIQGVTHPFSDQEVARAALQSRGGAA